MKCSIQEIVEICKNRVNLDLLLAKNSALCVDGTSCCMKSSILAHSNRKVSKNGRINSSRNADTYFPSLIGYITSGILNLYAGGPRYEDRSPINVLDWCILWKLLDNYVRKFGNVAPDETHADMSNTLREFTEIISLYKNSIAYKEFSKHINCIALVNSNTDQCDVLRYARGKNGKVGNSDIERSSWKFYTWFQNFMYIQLYPDLYIDLAWFEDTDLSDVVSGIATFLNYTLDSVASKPVDYAQLINRNLPTPPEDYHKTNMETHIYRQSGRFRSRELACTNNGSFVDQIPQSMNVSNIVDSYGIIYPPIYAIDISSPLKDSTFLDTWENVTRDDVVHGDAHELFMQDN